MASIKPLFFLFDWFKAIESQSRALSTFLVFMMWVAIAVFIIYPLLRYIYCRFRTWLYSKFLINSSKNCKNAWLTVGRGFAWPFLPSWKVKKPDFVLYSKGVTYVVKQHSFYSRRKKIVFCSPERWCFTRQPRRRKTEKLLTIKAIDRDYRKIKTKPAPFYMIRYAQAIAREINAPCVPVMLHTPGVKFLNTKNGVVMNNGDYTFYGMVVSDNESFKKITLPSSEEAALPALTFAEKKEMTEKIKKVINGNLR